ESLLPGLSESAVAGIPESAVAGLPESAVAGIPARLLPHGWGMGSDARVPPRRSPALQSLHGAEPHQPGRVLRPARMAGPSAGGADRADVPLRAVPGSAGGHHLLMFPGAGLPAPLSRVASRIPRRPSMNQSEPTSAGIDETIGQVERLYQAVTGKDAPSVDAAYAPIPAEKDPSQHVEEQMSRLIELLGQGRLGPRPRPGWAPPGSGWGDDLPGLRRENVEVVVQGNTLTDSGSRPIGRDGYRLRSSEGTLGAFRRTFFFPGGIRGAEPSAQMREGVLEIRFPRPPATAAT